MFKILLFWNWDWLLGKLLYAPTKLTFTEALVSPIPQMLQKRHESLAYLNGSSTILDVYDFPFDRIQFYTYRDTCRQWLEIHLWIYIEESKFRGFISFRWRSHSHFDSISNLSENLILIPISHLKFKSSYRSVACVWYLS